MLADAGTSPRWSYGPGFTAGAAVLVFPPLFPVTGCAPETVAVHVLPVHEPFGVTLNVVLEVTSPSELLAASKPSAVKLCEPPAGNVAVDGLITMWSSWLLAVTCSEAVPVLPPLVPVTVCAPATVAVQVAPVQEPSGGIEKVVVAVTSPSELSYWSRPSAVYACDPPELMVAEGSEERRV